MMATGVAHLNSRSFTVLRISSMVPPPVSLRLSTTDTNRVTVRPGATICDRFDFPLYTLKYKFSPSS